MIKTIKGGKKMYKLKTKDIVIFGFAVFALLCLFFIAIDSNEVEEPLDVPYLSSMVDINNLLSQNMIHIADVSNAAGTGEITYEHAGILFDEIKTNFNMILQILDSLEVPEEYTKLHGHYRNAVVYLIEAMELSSEGALEMNPNMVQEGAQKINLANEELRKIEGLLI